jgi:hypothetical protein
MEHSIGLIAIALLMGCGAAVTPPASAQTAEFKVAWSTLGEVVSAAQDAPAIKPDSKIVRVDVQPAILEISVGKQVCLSALQVRAFDPDSQPLAGAPITVSIRDDQKALLQLTRPKGDICMRPARAGEYPIRFTSKLTAPDDTRRGAQVFLRVS